MSVELSGGGTSARRQQSKPQEWLVGGGEMGKLIRSMDWSTTPLGPIELWPQGLRTTVSLCLASNFPIALAWGPKHVQIYNDGYWPISGEKHPGAMGQDFTECWAAPWPVIGEAFKRALAGGAARAPCVIWAPGPVRHRRWWKRAPWRHKRSRTTYWTFPLLFSICSMTG